MVIRSLSRACLKNILKLSIKNKYSDTLITSYFSIKKYKFSLKVQLYINCLYTLTSCKIINKYETNN